MSNVITTNSNIANVQRVNTAAENVNNATVILANAVQNANNNDAIIIDSKTLQTATVQNNSIAVQITNKIAQEMYNEDNEKYALAARFFRKSAATFTIAVIVLMHKNQSATEIAKIVQAQKINKGHASYKKCLTSVQWAAAQMSISLG